MRLFVLLAFASGCVGGSFEPRPGQNEAEKIVWNELYGETGPAPPIEWFDGDGSLFHFGGDTYDGLALPGWKIQVGIKEDATCSQNGGPEWNCSISAYSSFAHELMHYRTYLRTGDVDAAHERGDWNLADWRAGNALQAAHL